VKKRSADWKIFTLWVIGLALAAVCLGWVLRTESEHQLEQSAEQSAMRWAQFADRTVPDLEAALAGGGITPAARRQLARLLHADDVFHFDLLDATGKPVLSSDELTGAPLPPAQSTPDDAGSRLADESSALILGPVLAGHPQVALRRAVRAGRASVYSQAYVPVKREGKVLGVVKVSVDQTERASLNEDAFLRVAGAVAALLLVLLALASYQFWVRLRRQRQADIRVRYMAHHDALSGALNRASFNEVLQQAAWRRAEGGPPFSLLCIDLDHFKEVNDSFGHAAGDQVLRVATQRLKASVREGDQVARLGGDEFAIVLLGVATVEAVTPLAQRIVEALALGYELADQRVLCGGSVGVAIHGLDATDPDDLLGKADLALYRAKAKGRGSFSFYDVAMDQQMQARRELTRDLREAISADQMSLHYQPLYGRDAHTLTGYEALLRWHHPTRGDISPVEFIALAEETGLIDAIGLWVLRRACAEAATWPASLTVAVNLSALQFASDNLVELVTRALSDADLAPTRLELEITESLLMHNTDQVIATLRALSALGVSIAMDDFGTGYSSLAYLWRFPFDKVKIDRAFTHNLGHDAKVGVIVHSIISLAHSLKIRVNAEGVETPSQMAALQDRGCDEFQGFLLGRPGPREGLTHVGRVGAPASSARRAPPRESLFASYAMDLPATLPGPAS
jgi:diguanylate cyclase (GGDEF)-like protein